jgi:hypothetical protein
MQKKKAILKQHIVTFFPISMFKGPKDLSARPLVTAVWRNGGMNVAGET